MSFWAKKILVDFKVWLKKPVLVRAAKRGGIGKVRKLLERGVAVDLSDGYGRTALMEAARHGHLEIVRLLLYHGADRWLRSGSGKTALFYAQDRAIRDLLSQDQP
jgi:ankyrin repeat protein